MKEFVTVKELSKGQSSPYKYVKTWFMANYPNYSETPEFDEEGFILLHTKAEGTEEHKTPEAAAKVEEAPAVSSHEAKITVITNAA